MIAALYRFAPLRDIASLQQAILPQLKALGIKGSLLIAEEGINGTIAGAQVALDDALAVIRRATGLSDFEIKFAPSTEMPFRRMKVRLKKEIVTIGPVRANPNERVGHYVAPEDWNELISAPDVIVIDTRNSYEFGVGTFKGVVDPQTESFGQFPGWVREKFKAKPNARIAMFCTGGIRCEKASAFMLNEGFENVYHLKGGILKYLETVPAEQSLWQGGCYVFDERVAVGHGLKTLDFTTCHGCLGPVSAADRCSPKYEEGVCCPACADLLTAEQKASNRERQRQVDLAAKRGLHHLGPVKA
jgi:UPF0176 protein